MNRAMLMTAGQIASYDQFKQVMLQSGYFRDNPTTHFTYVYFTKKKLAKRKKKRKRKRKRERREKREGGGRRHEKREGREREGAGRRTTRIYFSQQRTELVLLLRLLPLCCATHWMSSRQEL